MADDRRTAILQAARALFAAEPFQDVGTRDICTRAGIGNGSLFHVFDGKVALAAELYQAACRHRDQVVETVLAAWPDDPRRAIHGWDQDKCKKWSQGHRRPTILFRTNTYRVHQEAL